MKYVIIALCLILSGCAGMKSNGAIDYLGNKPTTKMGHLNNCFKVVSIASFVGFVTLAEIHKDLEDTYGEEEGKFWYTTKNILLNRRINKEF